MKAKRNASRRASANTNLTTTERRRRASSQGDPRIAARSKEIRARLKESLEILSRRNPGFPKAAADIAQRLIVIGARQRIFLLDKWSDLEQVENGILLGMTEAALLTAVDCGMTRRGFAAWLRRTAANVEDAFFPGDDNEDEDPGEAYCAKVREALRK